MIYRHGLRVSEGCDALGRHQLRQLHDHHPPSEGLARVDPPTLERDELKKLGAVFVAVLL